MFNKKQQESIIEAIRLAELNTSGEIRLHVEPKCAGDAYERALQVFAELKMHETEQKNGVLFYLAYKDKKFSIVGDEGIHNKVKDAFWNEVRDILTLHFKQDNFTEGLVEGIAKAGEKLKSFFPYQSNDSNELSNDISFGGQADA